MEQRSIGESVIKGKKENDQKYDKKKTVENNERKREGNIKERNSRSIKDIIKISMRKWR